MNKQLSLRLYLQRFMSNQNLYFASDFHLGAPNFEESMTRELKIIRWLDSIKSDAKAVYLLGDIFDFWHEYHTVVPKGFIRFLGKLAELSDLGIEIHLFTGNHDMWMKQYFTKEFNATIYYDPLEITISGKQFFIGHGDGLTKHEKVYNVLKQIFRNSFFQFLFQWLHPDIGMRIAQLWSRKSRKRNSDSDEFMGEDQEWLVQFCTEKLKTDHIDYFILGHRHLPLQIKLNEAGSEYINLGEWINQCNYAVFDGQTVQLLPFTE